MPRPRSLKAADGQHSLLDQVISGEKPNPYIQTLQGESVLLVICQYRLATISDKVRTTRNSHISSRYPVLSRLCVHIYRWSSSLILTPHPATLNHIHSASHACPPGHHGEIFEGDGNAVIMDEEETHGVALLR
jgi:hypothetical protein